MHALYQTFTTPNNVTISSEEILKSAMVKKYCIHNDWKEMMNEITEPLYDEIKALKEKNR